MSKTSTLAQDLRVLFRDFLGHFFSGKNILFSTTHSDLAVQTSRLTCHAKKRSRQTPTPPSPRTSSHSVCPGRRRFSVAPLDV